ncbi:MAG: glycoside hydrolase family 3 C-terminal domain-containing protein, partial [Opitutaceae bacterium]|nr:glycoside hydrolase family 3 C-terminal domain-containing protein [Opitutaceae bacterium]
EAIRQSVAAGLNVRTNFTPPADYLISLRQLVRDGRLTADVIDTRVRDVLRVKFRLGLFDQPYRDPAAATATVRAPAHLAVAAQAARESIVLLKNERQALPLDRAKLRKVLVAGPLADDPHGWWSRYGAQRLNFVTPLAGLRAALGPDVEVRYAQGVAVKDAAWPESDILKPTMPADVRAGIAAAVAAADGVDVIVAVLGETDELCRESASRISLELPGYQQELLEALHASGKPVVLVLSHGRALGINWAARHVDAIVDLWFPGEAGGTALADVLLGDYNPAGRLPVTVPRSVGQIPLNFPARPGSQAQDYGQVTGPLFAFGHGLSYTTFAYANLQITPERLPVGAGVTVSCDVTNTGARAGDEVVQLYLRDDYSSVVTFEQVLRGFARVHLAPGETRRVTFALKPADLALFDANQKWTVEPGRFTVWVGASSTDLRLQGVFTVTDAAGHAPEEAPVPARSVDPR